MPGRVASPVGFHSVAAFESLNADMIPTRPMLRHESQIPECPGVGMGSGRGLYADLTAFQSVRVSQCQNALSGRQEGFTDMLLRMVRFVFDLFVESNCQSDSPADTSGHIAPFAAFLDQRRPVSPCRNVASAAAVFRLV